MRALPLLMTPLLLSLSAAAYAGIPRVEMRCEAGCLSSTDAVTLVREDGAASITLSWTLTPPRGEELKGVHLRLGDPASEAGLVDQGPTQVGASGDGTLRIEAEVSPSLLASGRLAAVLQDEDGQVLSWNAWRVRTAEELRTMHRPPGGWSYHSGPPTGVLWGARMETGGRFWPRAGGSRHAWQLLQGQSTSVAIEADGPWTGAPGVDVHLSDIEPELPGRDRALLEASLSEAMPDDRVIMSPLSRALHSPSAELRGIQAGKDADTWTLIVTVSSRASVGQLGDALLHETGAQTGPPARVEAWASYRPDLHGRDPELLAALGEQLWRHGAVPGLASPDRVTGDGGASTLDLGLLLRAGGHELPDGVASVDLLATRVGFAVRTEVAPGATVDEDALKAALSWMEDLSQGVRLAEGGAIEDTWWATPAVAEVLTLPGPLRRLPQPLADTEPAWWTLRRLESGLGHQPFPDWLRSGSYAAVENGAWQAPPAAVRLSLRARLRAGAVQRLTAAGPNAHAGLVPVDAVAQFLLRLTLSPERGQLDPDRALAADDDSRAFLATAPLIQPLAEALDVPSSWLYWTLLAMGLLGGLGAHPDPRSLRDRVLRMGGAWRSPGEDHQAWVRDSRDLVDAAEAQLSEGRWEDEATRALISQAIHALRAATRDGDIQLPRGQVVALHMALCELMGRALPRGTQRLVEQLEHALAYMEEPSEETPPPARRGGGSWLPLEDEDEEEAPAGEGDEGGEMEPQERLRRALERQPRWRRAPSPRHGWGDSGSGGTQRKMSARVDIQDRGEEED